MPTAARTTRTAKKVAFRAQYWTRPCLEKARLLLLPFLCLCFSFGCKGRDDQALPEGVRKIELTSPAFREGKAIPKQYTGDGKDISPPLRWLEPPEGVKSFALICDDPDAPGGSWVHWVLFNLPADQRGLEEAMPTQEILASGARQGRNDSGQIGYGGPGPPPGKPHRYYFKLYALDTILDLAPGGTRNELVAAMTGHILAQGQLMGRYGR